MESQKQLTPRPVKVVAFDYDTGERSRTSLFYYHPECLTAGNEDAARANHGRVFESETGQLLFGATTCSACNGDLRVPPL